MAKVSKKKKKENNKYNAENEIIIGVTTKPKEKVRVDKKTTRTSTKPNQKKNTKGKNNSSTNKKSTSNKKTNTKRNLNRNLNKKTILKEEEIKKINGKKIAISIIVLLLVTIGGTIYYLTTPAFNIANIEVHGNEKNSVETYIS